MCGIDWCAFTWQAFATLVTGFAAVGGATFIGLRQHGLVREQAAIANRQAETAETAARVAKLKLRSDLFDRRLAVYLAVKNYLRAALSAKPDPIWDATPELTDQLVRAQFLFSNEITVELEDAIAKADELYDARIERNEAQKSGQNVEEMNTALRPLRRDLRDRIQKLVGTLGDEMKLYEERGHVDPR